MEANQPMLSFSFTEKLNIENPEILSPFLYFIVFQFLVRKNGKMYHLPLPGYVPIFLSSWTKCAVIFLMKTYKHDRVKNFRRRGLLLFQQVVSHRTARLCFFHQAAE